MSFWLSIVLLSRSQKQCTSLSTTSSGSRFPVRCEGSSPTMMASRYASSKSLSQSPDSKPASYPLPFLDTSLCAELRGGLNCEEHLKKVRHCLLDGRPGCLVEDHLCGTAACKGSRMSTKFLIKVGSGRGELLDTRLSCCESSDFVRKI